MGFRPGSSRVCHCPAMACHVEGHGSAVQDSLPAPAAPPIALTCWSRRWRLCPQVRP